MSAITARPRKAEKRVWPITVRVADPSATLAKLAEVAFLADASRGEIIDRLINAELARLREKTGWPGRVAS